MYILSATTVMACGKQEKKKETDTKLPSEWIKNATTYEVNVRQYTEEGSLAAFEERLPKLKELGVDALWFMPIQPTVYRYCRKAQ